MTRDDRGEASPADKVRSEDGRLFAELAAIARTLRGEDGCPWDREQTLDSLVPYILEEAHEVAESVADGPAEALRAELGDLLFLILMMAAISEERGAFRLADVLAGSAEKMRRRHPHVFGEVQVGGSADVMRNWEAIKRTESSDRSSLLEGVPKTLSALLRARRVQEKAAHVGFDWPDSSGALAKIDEETAEIRERIDSGADAAGEIGDLLFSVVNLSRFLRINPEDALRATTEKFLRRFRRVEDAMAESDRPLTLEEMDRAWNQAKREET
jgi:MazG family protein